MDILVADNRVTALVSRSLSATSGISESGTAPTEAKRNTAERKVVKRKDVSILGRCYKRGRGRSNECGGTGRKMNERTQREAAKGELVDRSLLVKCSLQSLKGTRLGA